MYFHVPYRVGASDSESGGAGTSYLESTHSNGTLLVQKLTVDNNGLPYPHALQYNDGDLRNLLDGVYENIDTVGGVTWLKQENPNYR